MPTRAHAGGRRHATRCLAPLAVLAFGLPALAGAQGTGRWREIGRTVVGNPVEVDARSVRRVRDTVTATMRVRFVKPARSPRGPITSARTVASFDCARRLVAIRENTLFHDERAGTVYERRVVGIPGWAPPMGGSMPEVAIAHLCRAGQAPAGRGRS